MTSVFNPSKDQLDRTSAGSLKLSTGSKVPLFLGHPAPYICKSGICGGDGVSMRVTAGPFVKWSTSKTSEKYPFWGLLALIRPFRPRPRLLAIYELAKRWSSYIVAERIRSSFKDLIPMEQITYDEQFSTWKAIAFRGSNKKLSWGPSGGWLFYEMCCPSLWSSMTWEINRHMSLMCLSVFLCIYRFSCVGWCFVNRNLTWRQIDTSSRTSYVLTAE